MRSTSGYTLAELITTVLLVLGLVVIVMVALPNPHGGGIGHNTTYCAANLSGMYKSMYTYSVSCADTFPIWGDAPGTDPGDATGFTFKRHANAKATPSTPGLQSNVTASLWMMVRDGGAGEKNFICPSSGNSPDPMTLPGVATPAVLEETFDFLTPDNLSYSTINMYGDIQKRKWGSNIAADNVIMGDNNNNVGPHTSTKKTMLTADQLEAQENSLNHGDGQGQNLLFGDGHVAFTPDPYRGRADDNVFAANTAGPDTAEVAVAPLFALDQSRTMANAAADSMLLPVTGNGGGRGSLDPND